MELPVALVPTPMKAPVLLPVPPEPKAELPSGLFVPPVPDEVLEPAAEAPVDEPVFEAPEGLAAPELDGVPSELPGVPKMEPADPAVEPNPPEEVPLPLGVPDPAAPPTVAVAGEPGIPGDSDPAIAPRPEVGSPASGSPKKPRGVVLFWPTGMVRHSVVPVRGSVQRRRRNRMLLVFSSCSSEPG